MDSIKRSKQNGKYGGASRRVKFSAQKILFAVTFIIFILYAASLVFPLMWLVLNSFRNKVDFFFEPLSFPDGLEWINYSTVFGEFNILFMFLNSLVLSLGGMAATVLCSSMAAYVVSKYKFKARNAIYVLAITLMIIPSTGSIAAQYRLMNDTGLAGTHIGMIVLYAGGFGTNFFLLYGYFKSVSWSYAEAAQIDGAGNFQIFLRVMLPQAVPALFSVGIVSFIGLWNDYFAPFLYLKNFPTLAVGIQLLSEEITIGANASDYPALFAAMVIATLPVIALFAVFQKTIISNTVAGGLKG